MSKPTQDEAALWDAGERIAAIKEYRARVGCSLVEAMCAFDPETAARHRVIAAAPDLLAVLQSLRDVYSEHMAALPDRLQTGIREAIAKVEGRA